MKYIKFQLLSTRLVFGGKEFHKGFVSPDVPESDIEELEFFRQFKGLFKEIVREEAEAAPIEQLAGDGCISIIAESELVPSDCVNEQIDAPPQPSSSPKKQSKTFRKEKKNE